MKAVVLGAHAEAEMARRNISIYWVRQAIGQPLWTEPDSNDPEVTRCSGRIEDAGGRVLRVAIVDRPTPHCAGSSGLIQKSGEGLEHARLSVPF
jgi:hypothetical protein